MRIVKWTDEDGYTRQALLRDSDPDEMAACGIPLDPPKPAVDGIPGEVLRDLHNELVARGLVTWHDVLAQQSGVTATVMLVARRHNLSNEDSGRLRRATLIAYRR